MVEPGGDPFAYLREREMLRCLGTCAHLLDAVAAMVRVLLRSCLGVAVLATIREPLGVESETVWRVLSLAERDSMVLFGERAA